MPADDPTTDQPASASRPANRARPMRTRKLVRQRERIAEAMLRANPRATNVEIVRAIRAQSDGVGISLETLATLRERLRNRRRATAQPASPAQAVAASAASQTETVPSYVAARLRQAERRDTATLALAESLRDTGGDPVAMLATTVRALFPRATRVTLRFDDTGNPVVELTQAGKVGP